MTDDEKIKAVTRKLIGADAYRVRRIGQQEWVIVNQYGLIVSTSFKDEQDAEAAAKAWSEDERRRNP